MRLPCNTQGISSCLCRSYILLDRGGEGQSPNNFTISYLVADGLNGKVRSTGHESSLN